MSEEDIHQSLGYADGALWIRFKDQIYRFPQDTLLDPCTKVYLESHRWTYQEGNGCGSTRVNRWMLKVAQALIGVDLTNICQLHDLSYSLDVNNGCVKTYRHKTFCDHSLEYNIIAVASESKDRSLRIRFVAFSFMLAVRLFGSSSYWKYIPLCNRV